MDKKISTIVDNTNGIGNAISFLSNLKKLCEGYKGEMESEEKILSFITKYKSAGNTVIIITHDKELLDKADYVVNIE